MTPSQIPVRPAHPATRRRAMGGALAILALGLAAPLSGRAADSAAPLASPVGPVILTLSGEVAATGTDGVVALDLAMLDALPQRETVTATPWHDGVHRFSGPTMASILDLAGASGTTLRITALNDYAADFPVADARDIPVILATRIDGEVISIRDKGPLFVIYPFDERPDLSNEVYFDRSVWQVRSIEVGG